MVEKVKTGTTCIGMEFDGGIILAADRRTTAGYIVSDRTSKVYNLTNFIVGTTAGHAADTQRVMRGMKSELKLIEFKAERPARVVEAAMLINNIQYNALRAQGSIISIILGGYDSKDGFSLFNLGPDGTIVNHDGYVVDGSGSVYVKGILDMEYKKGLSEKEAITLVEKGFGASFKNDNMSGGGFIIKVVTKDGVKEVERKIIKSELVNE